MNMRSFCCLPFVRSPVSIVTFVISLHTQHEHHVTSNVLECGNKTREATCKRTQKHIETGLLEIVNGAQCWHAIIQYARQCTHPPTHTHYKPKTHRRQRCYIFINAVSHGRLISLFLSISPRTLFPKFGEELYRDIQKPEILPVIERKGKCVLGSWGVFRQDAL